MRTLLAVSGGIDSMCMADMYSHAGEEYAVAHCNFHLRGEESDGDAELVERWAHSHGVRFYRADFDTVGYASEHGVSIEMAARELRYAWFRQVAEAEGFDAIATAHNANDNAETLILNLLRGTGTTGLRGMSAEGGTNLLGAAAHGQTVLVRPMLGMTRTEIEAYAREHGVEYREDRTNAENVYKRNRIRNVVFPEFEKINPSFIRTLGADMERFAQVDDIAEDYFREAEGQLWCTPDSISVSKLLGLKHWRYVLFRALEPFGFRAQVIAELSVLLEKVAAGADITFSGKEFSSSTHVLRTAPGRLVIRDRRDGQDDAGCMTVPGPGRYSFAGAEILVEELPCTPDMPLKQPQGVLLCDAGVLTFPFLLRGWMEGDWFRPFGMDGQSKKLSDLFTDLKLSRFDKEAAIVAVSPALNADGSGHVAAVLGHRMDEALRITKGSVKCIRISILP